MSVRDTGQITNIREIPGQLGPMLITHVIADYVCSYTFTLLSIDKTEGKIVLELGMSLYKDRVLAIPTKIFVLLHNVSIRL